MRLLRSSVSTIVFATTLTCWSAGAGATSSPMRSHASLVECGPRLKPSGSITIRDSTLSLSPPITSLNPYLNGTSAAFAMDQLIFRSLFQYDDHHGVVPDVATRVPSTSNGDIRNGGRTVVIRLRSGQRWSNEAEITSADVEFGWEVDLAGGVSSLAGPITAIYAPNRYTAVLYLRRADPSLLLAGLPDVWPHAWPGYWTSGDWRAAVTALQDPSFTFLGPQFPTDGPYGVVSHSGTTVDFQAMRYYSGSTCGTHIRSVRFVLESPPAPGQAPTSDYPLDYAFTSYPANVAALRAEGYTAGVIPVSFLEHLELNHDPTYDGKPNPLADRLVRLALALAVDKRALIQQVLGFPPAIAARLEARTFVLNASAYHVPYADLAITGQWDPIARKYVEPGSPAALADARTLLARTPFSGGFPLDLYTTAGNPARVKEVQALIHDWSQLGVDLNPEYISGTDLYNSGGKAYTGDFQVAMFALCCGPDIAQFKDYLASAYDTRRVPAGSPAPFAGGNFAGIHDRAIDRAFATASVSSDSQVLAKAYATVQVAVNRNADWIPLHFGAMTVVHSTRIHHFSPDLWTIPTWILASG